MKPEKKKQLVDGGENLLDPPRRFRRSMYLLPSVFTVANMFAGFFAVISTLNGRYDSAAIAIGIAVVLDGLDGRVARMTNATSDFGGEFDSLADVITFGIAPAILVYSWGLADFGKFGPFSAFFFLICGAIRLARFNLQGGRKHFIGLPIPAGAGFIAATVHIFGQSPQTTLFKFYLVGIIFLLAFLMISTIPYPSFKRMSLSRGKPHLNVLMLALLVAGVIWYSQEVLMSIAAIYLCSGLLFRGYQFLKYRAQESESVST